MQRLMDPVFFTPPVVKSSLSGLLVAVEVLEVVVEVGGSGAQEPAEEGGVSREDGGQVDLPDPGHDESDPGHPFVKVSYDPGRAVGVVLGQVAEVAEEFGHHESGKKAKRFAIRIFN